MKKLFYLSLLILLYVTSCKPKPPVEETKPITLSVDTTEILANGEDIATFTVLCDKEDVTDDCLIYFAANNEQLSGYTFSTTEPDTCKFYARRGEVKSNTVTIIAKEVVPDEPDEPEDPDEPEIPEVEGPITISASTDTIVANGIDAVNFTVIQDSTDVTSLSKIYINDSIIESNVFSTIKSGNYIVYAKKNDTIISNEISFFAKEYIEPEIPITITASTDTIIADGVDAVIFTVAEGRRNITNEIDIFVNGNKIDGNKFTTTVAGEYTAYAKRGDVTSNEISFFAKEVEEPEEPEKPIELYASKTNIIADGTDAVTFTVKQDNNEVTSESEIYVNGNKINGNTFTTTVAGNYEVYAKKGELVSNEINIFAEEYIEPEKPIVLSASTTSITANGSDAVVFTVMQDGDNVTNVSEIYVNNILISGNQFSTFTPGTYTAFAKKNEVTSNEITFTAEEEDNPDTGTSIVFVEGVTINSGWYDVNKLKIGGPDINMCWAASASNIIQWWQDRYVSAGNSLPSGAVSGPGTKVYEDGHTYNLALMEVYRDLWNDIYAGGYPDHGVIWYFEGRNIYSSMTPGYCPQPNAPGGYYSNVWNQILPYMYHEYTNGISGEFGGYYLWGGGSGLSGNASLQKFTDYVVEFIDRGAVSLVISLGSNGGLLHATTLWGYEIDNTTGLITKIWITDSDDIHQGSTSGDPTQQLLREYTISYDGGSLGKIKLGGAPYGACWAMTLYPFSGYGSR
ncbi:MAG: IdeS/Mac family cysteine endopeptidase [Bacteroidales bacterium]|nr:IdeS/Mac family cysteine endopeptidase [Bacteroidales bacterium]